MIATARELISRRFSLHRVSPNRPRKTRRPDETVCDPRQLDRTADAKRKRALLSDRDWITHVVRKSRSLSDSIADCSTSDLAAHTRQLQQYRLGGAAMNDTSLLTLASAVVLESVRQSLGLKLFDVQIHAGISVSLGVVAEMQTGEGKTLAGILPAYLHALSGRGVHVATTNNYLAGRDYKKTSAVFSLLNLTTGLLQPDAPLDQTRAAYQADVTYGPGHAFGFDYLRDQLAIESAAAKPIGQAILDLMHAKTNTASLRQRGFHCAIVDEIDHVLIDDAVSPLLLSGTEEGQAPDADVHFAARELAQHLVPQDDFQVARTSSSVSLTERGFDKVYADQTLALQHQLVRPWHEYIILALRAEHLLQRDVHYVVRDQRVQIVDSSTGRIFADRTWSEGLHQAVQTVENVDVTPQTTPLASITRQRFFRYYEHLSGMTGTASECEKEFAKVYGLAVEVISPRLESRRKFNHEVIVESEADKCERIANYAAEIHKTGQPILIGTLDIAQSRRVAEQLNVLGLNYQLLNGVQDADEADIIAQAGSKGAITVATNMAGRGTDIQLDDVATSHGGLHVLVAQRHLFTRVDRQLVGRCARCGDPGRVTFFLSPEDRLPASIAPWIAKAIYRHLNNKQANSPAIGQQLLQAQRSQQRLATSRRLQMLRSDRELELLIQQHNDPTAPADCWQL